MDICRIYENVVYILVFLTFPLGLFSMGPEWLQSSKIFQIYHRNKTWNEAREICHMNNNTLLKIPDVTMWSMWLDVLDPTQGYPNRDISIYWFGLHAPNASDLSNYYWDGCSKAEWIEWKTSDNRQAYAPTVPCGFFDVYFNPFTNILMKIWAMAACISPHYFVCENMITNTNGCSEGTCQEYVLSMANNANTDCTAICLNNVTCNSRFFNVSEFGFCHIYPTSSQKVNGSFNLCYMSFSDFPLQTCTFTKEETDFSSIINNNAFPDDECLHVETDTTVELTTDSIITLTPIVVTSENRILSTDSTTGSEQSSSTTESRVTTHITTDSKIFTDSATNMEHPSSTSELPITTTANAIQTTTTTRTATTTDDTKTTTDTNITTSVVTSGNLCTCPCNKYIPTSSTLSIEEQVQQIKKELTVDKKNTSSHRRKFISIADTRPSATGIGSLGIGILVAVLSAIFLMDLATLKSDFITMFHNIKSLWSKRSSKDIAMNLRKTSIKTCNSLSKNRVSVKAETETAQKTVKSNKKSRLNDSQSMMKQDEIKYTESNSKAYIYETAFPSESYERTNSNIYNGDPYWNKLI